jgi:DNA-binding CsgD family transcriptional regulator
MALTSREQEVLQAIADGLTVAEAAQQMTIAIDTARTHIRNAKSKLGVRSQLEAVMVALRAGLVELQPPETVPEPAMSPPLRLTHRPPEFGLAHHARPTGTEEASLSR